MATHLQPSDSYYGRTLTTFTRFSSPSSDSTLLEIPHTEVIRLQPLTDFVLLSSSDNNLFEIYYSRTLTTSNRFL